MLDTHKSLQSHSLVSVQSAHTNLTIISGEEMINPVYDMNKMVHVELRPYMRYVDHIHTTNLSDEVWETALKLSVTDAEYAMILNSRKRGH